MLDLTNEELALVNKSLSITYDATLRRIDRLTGRSRTDALDELDICEQAIGKAKAEQMRRLRQVVNTDNYADHVLPPDRKTQP